MGTVEGAEMVVEQGKVTCVGISDACDGAGATLEIDLKNVGSISPGWIEGGSFLGLEELSAEARGVDGAVNSVAEAATSVRAVDAMDLQSRHVEAAFLGGVLSAVTRPMGTTGVSAFVSMWPLMDAPKEQFLVDSLEGVVGEVGLNLVIGHAAKGVSGDERTGSISGQFAVYDAWFAKGDAAAPMVKKALDKEIPVVAKVASVVDASVALRLARKYEFNLVLTMFPQAESMISELKQAQDDGILQGVIVRVRTPPNSWDNEGANWCSVAKLIEAGVNAAVSIDETDVVRDLRWDAAMMHQRCGLTVEQALESGSLNVAKAFGVENEGVIQVGSWARLVMFNGDNPNEFGQQD
eukprot:GABV01000508.1.p1 GENE.GABV01000508.1~~GABV01000508.1.p1  ORF type:complete len:352 (+),score=135.42 GABV01000508.1:136-1191(+)